MEIYNPLTLEELVDRGEEVAIQPTPDETHREAYSLAGSYDTWCIAWIRDQETEAEFAVRLTCGYDFRILNPRSGPSAYPWTLVRLFVIDSTSLGNRVREFEQVRLGDQD